MAKRSKKNRANRVEASAKFSGASRAAQSSNWWLGREWIWGVALLLGVAFVYFPVIWADYIWDDGMFVTTNPVIVGPYGLKEIWTTRAADVCPLTLTLFWFVHPAFGLAPLPYHLINVFLHGISAFLLWRVLHLLRIPGSWLGAAIWALHPVNVESVAWIAETKNTLSTLFYLLATLFFVKGLQGDGTNLRKEKKADYGLMLLFSVLAMASKSSTVILPVELCLCAWWVQGRWQWRNALKVAPIFFFSLVAGLVSMWTQKMQEATITDVSWERSLPERLATSGDAIWFYLGKLIWPDPLMMVYPRWQIDAGNGISYLPLVATGGVTVVLWLKRNSWARPWFFAWIYFLVALSPVLGLVNTFYSRYSFVADHFQYLASMGPLALVGAGIVHYAGLLPRTKWLLPAAGTAAILILSIVSWNRSWAFISQETIWTDTIAKNPACWVGYNNMGNAYSKNGQAADAITQYQKALDIHPTYAEAESNLGNALLHNEQPDQAFIHYQRALEIDPGYTDAHYNLGVALLQVGQTDKAMEQFQTALSLDPIYAPAYYNVGFIFLQKGQVDEAVSNFQKTLAIKPDHVDARNNLGAAYARMGKWDEAVAQFAEILRQDPSNTTVRSNLEKAQDMARQTANSK